MKRRFDGASARRILERAAAVQHRLDQDASGSYSLEELEEMAAEAGISREALHAALETPEQAARAVTAVAAGARSRRGPSALGRLLLGHRAPALQAGVLIGGSGLALFGALLAFPAAAQVLLWTTIVLSVLILMGASPF